MVSSPKQQLFVNHPHAWSESTQEQNVAQHQTREQEERGKERTPSPTLASAQKPAPVRVIKNFFVPQFPAREKDNKEPLILRQGSEAATATQGSHL